MSIYAQVILADWHGRCQKLDGFSIETQEMPADCGFSRVESAQISTTAFSQLFDELDAL